MPGIFSGDGIILRLNRGSSIHDGGYHKRTCQIVPVSCRFSARHLLRSQLPAQAVNHPPKRFQQQREMLVPPGSWCRMAEVMALGLDEPEFAVSRVWCARGLRVSQHEVC
jgi:hypothetical protein